MRVLKLKGFGLLELCIVIAILSILSTLAIEGMQENMRYAQQQSQAQILMSLLQTTRLQSLIMGTPLVLCDGLDACEQRWQGHLRVLNGDKLINYVDLKLAHATLHWAGALHRPWLHFNPQMYANNLSGTFWLCDNVKQRAVWQISLNRVGNPHLHYHALPHQLACD